MEGPLAFHLELPHQQDNLNIQAANNDDWEPCELPAIQGNVNQGEPAALIDVNLPDHQAPHNLDSETVTDHLITDIAGSKDTIQGEINLMDIDSLIGPSTTP